MRSPLNLLLLVFASVLLSGCFTEREASTHQVRGTWAGQPVTLAVDGRAERQAGLDVEAAIGAAVAAAEGRFGAALAAVRPPTAEQLAERVARALPPPPSVDQLADAVGKAMPPRSNGIEPETAGLGGLATTLAGFALSEFLRRRRAERNEDEVYVDARANAQRAEQHALARTPPPANA